MSLAGVYETQKKDGSVYFRSSFTYKNKHISLGSFANEYMAHKAYEDACELINCKDGIDDYNKNHKAIPFDKYVSIINFRDNNIYFKNPIYLQKHFFFYHYSPDVTFKFDIDDLFFYASHKISKRNGHIFVADYGMQINLITRYGIMSHAVKNRDYKFINGNPYDFRYENIEVINHYYGVRKCKYKGKIRYRAKILINGSYTIGVYDTEIEAAIAYNKAADIVKRSIPEKNYQQNFIDGLSPSEYASYYVKLPISDKILEL